MPASAVREELRMGSLRAIDLPGYSFVQPVVALQRARGFQNAAEQAFLRTLRRLLRELAPA